MIARHWRGWTAANNADAYERLLKETVLPGLKVIAGYNGGYIFRKDLTDEVEFVVVNFFESLDSVRKFAGENYATAVFEPAAKRLLSRIEPEAAHYEVRADTVFSQPIFQQSDHKH
jgi:heme-degrading monooxygenase HmoA